jgi:antibiotic biosynthesis monooxygenase (ABM) superfamily enzyme
MNGTASAGTGVHIARASAVIVQRVPAADVDWFLGWQADVGRAAEASGGYCGTDVFPPSDGKPEEWVVLIHFEDRKALDDWLDSPVRMEWVDKLRAKVGDFDLKALSGGFGPWFAQGAGDPAAAPPGWKMALTVLLALFPTVMLLTIFVGPYTLPLGLAASMLIGNALSISILQWVVMPVLTKRLGPWLGAHADGKGVRSFATPALILLVLAILMILFRQVTG